MTEEFLYKKERTCLVNIKVLKQVNIEEQYTLAFEAGNQLLGPVVQNFVSLTSSLRHLVNLMPYIHV